MRNLSHPVANNDTGNLRAWHADEPHGDYDRMCELPCHGQHFLWGDDGHQTGESLPVQSDNDGMRELP
jgi:hypothetical protein